VAECALELEISYSVILPLPPASFMAEWDTAEQEQLDHLLARAAQVDVVGGEGEAAYTERNRRVAQVADWLIAVWTGVGAGGTAETIRLAKQLGKRVDEHVLAAVPDATSAQGRGR
jgi:hypothetical protein